MKFLLFDHSGCLNRGCEAIVRTTVKILEAAFPGSEYSLLSFSPKSDIVLSDIPRLTIKGFSAQPLSFTQKMINAFHYKFLHRSDYYFRAAYKDSVNFAADCDVCLCIGGDTFCYGDNELCRSLIAQFKAMGKKVVLWGCSVGEEDLTPEKIETLRIIDGIFARESLTKEALENAGIKNARLFADPAFTLETAEVDLEGEHLLGINLSELVAEYCPDLAQHASRFLEKIEKETHYTPVLIPHVTINAKDNNDYAFLKEIYDNANLTKTVILPDTLSASQYKGYIKKCELLIAARTHASIGAYSNCVPVFALSYSIKARGIAKELFGEELCVADVKSVESADSLFAFLHTLEENADKMRSILAEVIPEKKALAFSAGEALKEII